MGAQKPVKIQSRSLEAPSPCTEYTVSRATCQDSFLAWTGLESVWLFRGSGKHRKWAKRREPAARVRAYLELEGNRFLRGWGGTFSLGPPGMDVKKRRKPEIQGAESALQVATRPPFHVLRLPAPALKELLAQRQRPGNHCHCTRK